MDKLYKMAAAKSRYIKEHHKYKMMFWDRFDYSILTNNVMYYRKKGKFQKGTWNDIIIAADTETSKSHEISSDPLPNHICAWTVSIRIYHINLVTLYGTRPSELIQTIQCIRDALKGDEFSIYFFNLSYDYFFLRRFLFDAFGTPEKELNTKPHFPIMLKFGNGMMLRDALILAQCKLEKWAEDLNVEHQKAVKAWDYDKIRDQGGTFTRSELKYIEHDTLALVECLDAFCVSLNKNISSIVYTATGVPREELRDRAKKNNGHNEFLKQALTYEQMQKFVKLYHGGYSHANRFYIGDIMNLDETDGADFVSSYPFCALAYKYPHGRFSRFKNVKPEFVLRNCEDYAFIFKISFINIELKDKLYPMPALQASKCEASINMEVDNGRVLSAGYCTLYLCDVDLQVLAEQYKWDPATTCTEVETAPKDYLPRWFTDYVFELFADKCKRKPTKSIDPVGYALAKMRLNCLYGLCVQSSFIRRNYVEVIEPGEYQINEKGDKREFASGEYREDFSKDMIKQYQKYVENHNTVLCYQVGTYITAYAFRNVHTLINCVTKFYKKDGSLAYPFHAFYVDTDSCYSDDWNMDKVAAYNEHCKELLRANGYGPVEVEGKEYWLGIAEFDDDSKYSEFVFLGAKRYAGRQIKDGKLHITVAGVPKKEGALCLKNDLKKFNKDFVFDGNITGKKTHFYIVAENGIYTDEYGNEIGDSIDLQPCDYELDATEKYEYTETEDFYLPIYMEENL